MNNVSLEKYLPDGIMEKLPLNYRYNAQAEWTTVFTKYNKVVESKSHFTKSYPVVPFSKPISKIIEPINE